MGNETNKAFSRRFLDPLFRDRAFQGVAIDIGAGGNPLDRFTRLKSVEVFDLAQGDAQRITDFRTKESYDLVYSSNCLEHMNDPVSAFKGWWELVKPGGYLVCSVPDEDLYEQGVFPSRWNLDHKHTFTIFKHKSWSSKSVNMFDLVKNLPNCRILRLSVVDTNYNYNLKNIDQTSMQSADVEAFIEVILQKHPNN